MSDKIPKYIEGENPGFREYSPEDFAEPPEESPETQALRFEVLEQIEAEFDRLNLDSEMREFMAHSQGLGNDPVTASLLDLRLFLDWLRRIERQ